MRTRPIIVLGQVQSLVQKGKVFLKSTHSLTLIISNLALYIKIEYNYAIEPRDRDSRLGLDIDLD